MNAFRIASALTDATSKANEKWLDNKSDIEYSWKYNTKTKKTTILIIQWLWFNSIFDYKTTETQKDFETFEKAIKFLEQQAK